MAKGRKRKPDVVKQIQGTYRPSRSNPKAPKPSQKKPSPPSILCAREKQIFNLLCKRIYDKQYLDPAFTEVIALAAQRMYQLEELKKVIEKEHYIYWGTSTTGASVLKSNPAIAMRSDAMRHLHSLLAELGLTPAALSKVGELGTNKESNPWAEFA